ncbi:S-layer homology domain-containing protein [Tepidibacter mesophilus]|uniref:S-layer homology domain-containing protein n=1 Tax=Tepidibacter mesophilus TaxID=655607 RepID=UPI00165136EA|nr:S-layer homology domain-containing protein [Tepidibacter mesophilus]
MKNIISKLLIFLVFLNLISITDLTVFAENNVWSGESIGAFLYNEIDAPDVLMDEKYTKDITREEFAQLIVAFYAASSKIDKTNISLKENPFKDTNSIDVQRAYSLGILNGKSKDKYFPKANINREEIATMITRFLNIKGIDTKPSGNKLIDFKDNKKVSKWAYDSLSYCTEQGIIKGIRDSGDDELRPKDFATVEQVITALYRINLKNEWIDDAKDIYLNGLFIPKNIEAEVRSYSTTNNKSLTFISVDWNDVENIPKLQKDLEYIFKGISDDYEQVNTLVQSIMDTKYKDVEEQLFKIKDSDIKYHALNKRSPEGEPATVIRIDK